MTENPNKSNIDSLSTNKKTRTVTGLEYTQTSTDSINAKSRGQSRQISELHKISNLAIFSIFALAVFSGFWMLSVGFTAGEFSRKILGSTTAGLGLLEQNSLEQATAEFRNAQNYLQEFQSEISELVPLLPGRENLEHLYNSGGAAVTALEYVSRGLAVSSDMKFNWDAEKNQSGQDLYLRLKEARQELATAEQHLNVALSEFSEINTAFLPKNLQDRFAAAEEQLHRARGALSDVVRLEGAVLSLLGGEKKTYLLVFQNNDEMRATGGFVGTYGLLEFENGVMRIIKIESIYALDGQLRELIAAPGPLQRQATDYWGMRDANWFADFPASSRKMLAFLEKEAGILADGVIAFTPDIFEELLKIAGPVEMPEYLSADEAGGEVLTAENFRSMVQFKTSRDYDLEENKPKKFLSDFASRLLAGIAAFEKGQWTGVLAAVSKAVAEKDILLFSLDPNLQNLFEDFGASGRILQSGGDYLAVINSNVGGGKTDRMIFQEINKTVDVGTDGRAVTTVEITRANLDFEEEFFPNNINYMRVFVPAGSELLSADGFEQAAVKDSILEGANTDEDLAFLDSLRAAAPEHNVYQGYESGHTVFSGWQELMPGQSRTVRLRYMPPPRFDSSYSLLLQSQPGSNPSLFTLDVNLPEPEPLYFHPDLWQKKDASYSISENVSRDRVYGIVY